MPENNIKIEDLKSLFQQIDNVNQKNIKDVDHELSQRIDKLLDQTKNVPDEKLKDFLTPEFSKLVQDIEQQFGPIINDQSTLKTEIYNQIQTVKNEPEQKEHIIRSPGGGEEKKESYQQEQIEKNTRQHFQNNKQNMYDLTKVGGAAMAINAALVGGAKVIEFANEVGKKIKDKIENNLQQNSTEIRQKPMLKNMPIFQTMRDTVDRFKQEMHKDEEVLNNLQNSAEAAREAMQHFMNHAAGNIKQKMQKEAKNHPEGMDGVIQEMTNTGKQKALFKAMKKVKNKNYKAWKNVTESIHNYSKVRMAAMDSFKNSGPYYHEAVTKIDADIGKMAKNIPGQEGKNLMEELGEKVKQVVENAIYIINQVLINQVLNQKVDINHKPSSSSSPSPSF